MPIKYTRFHLSSAAMRMSAAFVASAALMLCASACGGHSHDDASASAISHDPHDGHDHEGHDHSGGNDPHDHTDPHNHADSEAGEDSHASSGEIILPECSAKAAGVVVEQAATSPFSHIIPTSGRILPAAGAESVAVATQAGIVRLARPWSEGMPVGAGTPLFSISGAALPEGDRTSRARIELKKAESEFARIERLYAEQLATRQEFDEAEAAMRTARLACEATSRGTSVSAPRAGFVLSCLVKDGDYVEAGTPLMNITSNRRLQLQADLPRRLAAEASGIVSANFRLGGGAGHSYSLAELNGRIISHGTGSASQSPFIPVIFEFDNAPGIVAGSFAEVWLIGETQEGVLAIPLQALCEEQGVYTVYVRRDAEGYERRVVTPGRRDGRRVEIIAGLKPGEEVVTSGATHVRLAAASNAIPGHTHEH